MRSSHQSRRGHWFGYGRRGTSPPTPKLDRVTMEVGEVRGDCRRIADSLNSPFVTVECIHCGQQKVTVVAAVPEKHRGCPADYLERKRGLP